MKKFLILLCSLTFSCAAFAQTWQDTVALIEQALNKYQPQNPGCQLSISRNGAVIFSKALGMADLEHNVPLTTNSLIEAGSVSKQFTAAAILLLEQQGKLSLDDNVRRYVPELRDYGARITLRHLMQHTSGLRDWGSVAALTGWPRTTKTYNNDDALEIISWQQQLNNKPGDEYIYSNSGYNLLAIIVQRVSGKSLADFTREYIFMPADMTNTQWRDNYKRIVPNRAIAYSRAKDGYETDMPNENVYGNGGLLTTTEDLLKWNAYYLSGKFGNPSLFPKQIALTPFNNGVMHNYGAGLFIDQVMGLDRISHSGATAGYRANLEYFPKLDLSIAFLTNTPQYGMDAATAVRNIFIKNPATEAPKMDKPVTVPVEKLRSYTGWYRNERTGAGVQIGLNGAGLIADGQVPLTPFADNQFSFGNNQVLFDGGNGFKFIVPGRDTIRHARADSINQAALPVNDYTGEYYSPETRSFATVALKEGNLILRVRPGEEIPLMPSYADGFTLAEWGGNLYFERDQDKKCTTMKVSISRARNVRFEKIGQGGGPGR